MTDSIEDRVLTPEKVLQRVELQRLANVRGSRLYDSRCDTKLPYDSSTIVSAKDNLFYCPLCDSNFENIEKPKNENLYAKLFLNSKSK